jgi:ribonuclease J
VARIPLRALWPVLLSPLDWLQDAGAEIAYIHTSGHASPADLREFATAVRPKMVVPVHGAKWDEESHGFGKVCRLADGDTMEIS